MGKINVRCARVGLISTNCYIVNKENNNECVIIDPGDNAFFLEQTVCAAQLQPAAILLTHAHFDHIGAVGELREKYSVPIYVNKLDAPMLADPELNLGTKSVELGPDDVTLSGGETLRLAGMEIQVIATPGHTPGGTCYYIPEGDMLFSGDTMFRFSWGRTDFPGSSESSLMESIREKLLTLPPETTVYPGHEGATTIRNERATHGYNDSCS